MVLNFNCWNLTGTQLRLLGDAIISKQLILHSIINPLMSGMTAELIWKGKRWIAFGIGPEGLTTQEMVGSHVVICVPESQQ
jgi:hypothetical protein